MNEQTKTRKLIEASLMIAIATALSLLKLLDLPFGGSVTLASMLPIVIIACRNGVGWGLASGAVFGAIQQLLGLKTLSYVTTWYSILAVILLDYIFAFTVIGFSGAFRNKCKKQNTAFAAGSVFACLLRYLLHVISGATVWAGLSIPTKAALLYSLAYNATYMIPETIVLVVVAYYVGSLLDFRADQPVRLVREAAGGGAYKFIGWLLIAAAAVFDVVCVFGKLQNAETGEFDFSGISALTRGEVIAMICVTAGAVLIACVLFIIAAKKRKAAAEASEE